MANIDDLLAEQTASYEDAKTLADNALIGMDDALRDAESAVSGIQHMVVGTSSNPTDVVPTDVTSPILPTGDFSVDVKNAFDYAFGAFNQDIQPQVLEYLSVFFPDIAQAVKDNSDNWIAGTIIDGRYVPIAVENAMWNRARDREVQDSLRAEQAIIDASASRAFSTPPGAAADAILVNQQDTSKRLTTISREITVKAFDVANENSKFAVAQAVSLRTAFVGALGDFIKTAMVQPNNATDYAKTILSAKTGLYDSAVRLYAAQIDEERMRTGVLLENNAHGLRSDEITRAGFRDAIDGRQGAVKVKSDVALAAAANLATLAGAALATRNTMINKNASA